jgi:hypothetical protein
MEASMTTQLSDIVIGLDAYIRYLRKLGLKQSALLMEMTKLDLQMRIHDITDVELDELCKAIERQEDKAPAAIARLPAMKGSVGTVISLFGADRRFSANGRAPSDNEKGTAQARGESQARGKAPVPR